jgi:hypothetical protein
MTSEEFYKDIDALREEMRSLETESRKGVTDERDQVIEVRLRELNMSIQDMKATHTKMVTDEVWGKETV